MACSLNLLASMTLVVGVFFSGTSYALGTDVQTGNPSSYPQGTAGWMGALLPFLPNGTTIFDLTLPGAHDSLTFDLSSTVANNANSLPTWLSAIMHNISDTPRDTIGKKLADFIRGQARTQYLNLTQQLDAGVRFVDFRIDFTAPPNMPGSGAAQGNTSSFDWYGLHLLETKTRAIDFLAEAKRWLDAHPQEVVVFLITHHSKVCGAHFHPQATPEVLHKLFLSYTELFGDLVFDGLLNETSIGSMVSSNKRAVFWTESYHNFTDGGSPLATDACTHFRKLKGNSVAGLEKKYTLFLTDYYPAALMAQARQEAKGNNSFLFQSIDGGSAKEQPIYAFALQELFNGSSGSNDTTKLERHLERKCAKGFHVPGMNHYCPPKLRASSQLANYYNQALLEKVLHNTSFTLPNVWNLNALDVGGVVRIGLNTDVSANKNSYRSYAMVDSIVLYNLNRLGGCPLAQWKRSGEAGGAGRSKCEDLVQAVQAARSRHPLQQWNDPEHGRLTDWPPALQ